MLKFVIQYDSPPEFVHAFSEKVAVKGLLLKTGKSAETGARVEISFRFKTDPQVLSAAGTIAWIDDSAFEATGKRSLIVKNIELDPPSRNLFNRLVSAEYAEAAPAAPGAAVMAATPVPQATPKAAAKAAPPSVPIHVAPPKSRWGLWLTLVLLFIGAGAFAGWYLELGGREVIANLGVEYRDGRITEIDRIAGSFKMGLVNQRSSDQHVDVGPQTQWVGVRGLAELQVGDRIGLRYKPRDGVYQARQITVKERLITGTVGSFIDKNKEILHIEDSKLTGSLVELTTEFNDNAKALLARLSPGDVVEAVYAVGQDGRNAVRSLAIKSRTVNARVTGVDTGERTLLLQAENDEDLILTVPEGTTFASVEWSSLRDNDRVRVEYSPEHRVLSELDLLERYEPPPSKPAPKAKPKAAPPEPLMLRDVLHSSDTDVARFALDFTRRPNHEGAVMIENPRRIMLRVPNARRDYARSEIFLSTGPLRTLRIEEQSGDLILTFLVAENVKPRYSFESEGNRLVALFFK